MHDLVDFQRSHHILFAFVLNLPSQVVLSHSQSAAATASSEQGNHAAEDAGKDTLVTTFNQSKSRTASQNIDAAKPPHNDPAESSAVAQVQQQTGDDSARITQLQQQATLDSTKVAQLERHAERLRKILGDKDTQYSQLLQQHQTLQAMATEVSQEGDQQEADLKQKDDVIQQLQQQLSDAQQILAEKPAPVQEPIPVGAPSFSEAAGTKASIKHGTQSGSQSPS